MKIRKYEKVDYSHMYRLVHFKNRFRYHYLCTMDSLKNDLLTVLLIELSFSGPVKLAVSFAYQESLACISDEIPARDEY